MNNEEIAELRVENERLRERIRELDAKCSELADAKCSACDDERDAELERLRGVVLSWREVIEDLREEVAEGQRKEWPTDPLLLAVLDECLSNDTGSRALAELRLLRIEADRMRSSDSRCMAGCVWPRDLRCDRCRELYARARANGMPESGRHG